MSESADSSKVDALNPVHRVLRLWERLELVMSCAQVDCDMLEKEAFRNTVKSSADVIYAAEGLIRPLRSMQLFS